MFIQLNFGMSGWVVGAGLAMIGLVSCGGDRVDDGVEPDRDAVARALEVAFPGGGGGDLFVGAESRGWFLDAGMAGWRVPVGAEATSRAGVDPGFWRGLDREHRFDAVGFFGTAAASMSLLGHLARSPDWTLAWVGADGCLFTRGGVSGVWRERLGAPSARLAGWLLDLGEVGAAEAMLGRLEAGGRLAELQRARVDAHYGRWDDVLDRLGADGKALDDAAARLVARALIQSGRGREAWRITRGLVEDGTTDGSLLFLHARAARAAGAWDDEVAALERLVELVGRTGAPTAVYEVYLAQAYASRGDSGKALEIFRGVRGDPRLPEAQRGFVEAAIGRLEVE